VKIVTIRKIIRNQRSIKVMVPQLIEPQRKLLVSRMASVMDEDDLSVEQWRIRKLIKSLSTARGAGTSMISLIIPGKDSIHQIGKMLTEEAGTASNIKSRVNRQSVLSAITSAQQRLKLYNKTPPNGLVLFTGTIMTEDGKEKAVVVDFEPFKPVNTSLYMCDSRFHTEHLNYLLESEDKFGFIVFDGSSCLYGTVQGSQRDVLHKFTVDLPKKHGRGGQSSVRFARLRVEKRHNYLRKVAELSTTFFISQDRPNVLGLILAGSAEFKNDLAQSDMFDPRLAAVLLKIVDVSYGGENGFNQAIELSADTLKGVKFVQEKKIITKYFEEVAQDTGKVCYGIEDTLKALDMGACELLLVFEGLDVNRVVIRNPHSGEITTHFLAPEQEKDDRYRRDPVTGNEFIWEERVPLTEWLAENYKTFGTKLEFVTNKSQEGAQFVKGFGGIGGMLRYKVEFENYEVDSDLDDDEIFM
jgi:peptide chain release factor subunit 1